MLLVLSSLLLAEPLGVTETLLLLVLLRSLALPPGVQGWVTPPPFLGSPGSEAPLPWWGEGEAGEGARFKGHCHCFCPLPCGCRCCCSWDFGILCTPSLLLPGSEPWLGAQDHGPCLRHCSAPCGCRCHRSWLVRVTCPPLLMPTGSPGLGTASSVQDPEHCLHCSLMDTHK